MTTINYSLLVPVVFLAFDAFSQTAGATPSRAVLAGGCFWCLESDLEKLPGVISAVSGYSGGDGPDPTYHDYAAKGHLEVVEVTFDPARLSYRELLDYFWRHIDPTDSGGQFVDRGPQYASAIFYTDEGQRREARASKAELDRLGAFGAPVVTPILPAKRFYPAEEYHQDYYKKNPLRYKFIVTDQAGTVFWKRPGASGTRSREMRPSKNG